MRLGEVIYLIPVGRVLSEDEVKDNLKEHPCFRGLEEDPLSFETSSREELEARKWKFSEASEAIKQLYNVDLKKEEGTLKSDIITQIFDARFREVD